MEVKLKNKIEQHFILTNAAMNVHFKWYSLILPSVIKHLSFLHQKHEYKFPLPFYENDNVRFFSAEIYKTTGK